MKPRIIAFVALAVVLAGAFVRLGFWQLERLSERRARNDHLRARLAGAEVDVSQLADTSGYRRAIVSGQPDYSNEILYTGRSRNGSPGVYLVTPIRRQGNDTAIAVIRGWAYAADAATVEQSAWREDRSTFRGYVLALPRVNGAPVTQPGRKTRTLSLESLQALLPYPVAPVYLVSQDSAGPKAPARIDLPALDNGPHLSYAVQWFCFALIAVGGAIIVARRSREQEPSKTRTFSAPA